MREMRFRDREPTLRADLLQEVGFKDFLRRQTKEESIGQDASGIRNIRAANVFARKAQLAFIQRQKADDRLDHAPAQPVRQQVINRKVLVLRISRVSAEELIAAVSSQQCAHAALLR